MDAIITMDENTKLRLALFALAHQMGRIERDEETGAPELRLEVDIPQGVLNTAFNAHPHISISRDRVWINAGQYADEDLHPNADMPRPCVLFDRKYFGCDIEGRPNWGEPTPQARERLTTRELCRRNGDFTRIDGSYWQEVTEDDYINVYGGEADVEEFDPPVDALRGKEEE